MLKDKVKMRGAAARGLPVLLFCALIAFVAVGSSPAQSGRRIPKRAKPAEPPSPKSEPVEVPSAEKPENPGIPVLVVRYSASVYDSGYYSSIVLKGCTERLKKSSSLDVRAGREMNRKEASDYAKGSSDIYVVWLEIDINQSNLNRGSSTRTLDDNLRVRYALYIPGTGKAKTQGQVYQRPYQPRVGGVGLPLPLPSGRNATEYVLYQAGEDAADRILDALNATIRPGNF